MEEGLERKRPLYGGFTKRVILAILYSIFVFQPAIIWMQLTTGATITGYIGWMTLVLFAEISRLYGKPLTKHEAAVIFLLSWLPGSIAGAPFFIDLINRAYYAHSPISATFGIQGHIPYWYTSLDTDVWLFRTFFDSSWIVPLVIATLMLTLHEAVNITLGLVARQLYVETEKLEFPIEQMQVVGIESLTERRGASLSKFWFGVMMAMIYSFSLYGPIVLSTILGYSIGQPPIPWADFSGFIQVFVPGAAFGVATDLLYLITGFVVPFPVVVSMFIGSFFIYLVGNPLIVKMGVTKFAKDYFIGMDVMQVMQRSTLYVWAGPSVGIAFAAGLLPLIKNRSMFLQALRNLSDRGHSELRERILSLRALLFIWLLASLSSVILAYILIPVGLGFLLIMLFFSLAWPFLWTLINARALGTAGVNIGEPQQVIPLVKTLYITTSGIKGYDIWFINPTTGAGGWVKYFKVLDLADCTARSLLKVFILMLPITLIAAFFYVQNFWSIAPIPSVMYPATAINWPVRAITDSLWYTGQMFTAFDPVWTVGAFLVTSGLYGAFQVLHVPLSVIGIAAGVNLPIPVAFTQLIGAIIGLVVSRLMGKEWWGENRMVLSAGISLGVALSISVFSVIGMLFKSLWALPY